MISIPAKPYEFALPESDGIALVVIDMQRDFIEPGGFGEALGNNVNLLRKCIPAIKKLLAAFREHRLPIIHTMEGHTPSLADCPPSKLRRGNSTLKIGDAGPMGRILVLGEPGNAIIPELAPQPDELVLTKPGKGAFFATRLEDHLREKRITHLVITGVTTEVCVQTTLREANDRGFECLLVEDGTESYFPEFKLATLEMIRAQGGIVGWTSIADQIVKALKSRRKAMAALPA